MDKSTAINSSNFVVAELKEDEIEGILLDHNKKIEFLPYKIYMQLPNLINYRAFDCSIKQIARENFENLSRLEVIWLSWNKIQRISGNTFKGLERLKKVYLSKLKLLVFLYKKPKRSNNFFGFCELINYFR